MTDKSKVQFSASYPTLKHANDKAHLIKETREHRHIVDSIHSEVPSYSSRSVLLQQSVALYICMWGRVCFCLGLMIHLAQLVELLVLLLASRVPVAKVDTLQLAIMTCDASYASGCCRNI